METSEDPFTLPDWSKPVIVTSVTALLTLTGSAVIHYIIDWLEDEGIIEFRER